jgi:hypothetical protein
VAINGYTSSRREGGLINMATKKKAKKKAGKKKK